MPESDTIVALSSGAPPAAIGIIRISGPRALAAFEAIGGEPPAPRMTSLRKLKTTSGELLDEALVLVFPGPNSATGEDCVELHCHGGRAVVDAVQKALVDFEGVRAAEPGEFTRRAFANGRMDLSEAEGLADLLAAETEIQRRSAIAMAGGAFSRQIEKWREEVLALSGAVEAVLDFGDEDDVEELPPSFDERRAKLANELDDWLRRPAAEKLREGYRVVLAGPPNSGKSTLFNRLLGREAAIVSDIAGTTRDVIEQPVAIGGVPFTFVDIAGLRDATDDAIEGIGIERARRELELADCILWLGPDEGCPDGAWNIVAQIDRKGHAKKADPRHSLSAVTGAGMDALKDDLVEHARAALRSGSDGALNARQRTLIADAKAALVSCGDTGDLLLKGESLREARIAFDRMVGRATTEDMLDALFGRFCIGK